MAAIASASEKKSNIIRCEYVCTVEDTDEGYLYLLNELFDMSKIEYIEVRKNGGTIRYEPDFVIPTNEIVPGCWGIDIKVGELTNCNWMFSGTSLLSCDFSDVDTSNIETCAYMFTGTLIEKPPFEVLPIKTLTEHCCMNMFEYCEYLTSAPILPHSTLVEGCYTNMFNGCSKLNYIKMLATDISAANCLYNWVYGVSPTGTFVKHPEATWDARGVNGVPDGWTIKFDWEEEGGREITFYVDDVAYTALDGMTWEQYVDSEYNIEIKHYLGGYTKMCTVDNGYVQWAALYEGELDYYAMLHNWDWKEIHPFELIVANKNYTNE